MSYTHCSTCGNEEIEIPNIEIDLLKEPTCPRCDSVIEHYRSTEEYVVDLEDRVTYLEDQLNKLI